MNNVTVKTNKKLLEEAKTNINKDVAKRFAKAISKHY